DVPDVHLSLDLARIVADNVTPHTLTQTLTVVAAIVDALPPPKKKQAPHPTGTQADTHAAYDDDDDDDDDDDVGLPATRDPFPFRMQLRSDGVTAFLLTGSG